MLDVYSLNSFNRREESATCEFNQLNGFWSPDDYYCFVNTFKYYREQVILDKYKRINPGSIDTQQAIYLATCDTFVTSDLEQRRMLRLLVPFGHKKRSVMEYSKFSKHLISC